MSPFSLVVVGHGTRDPAGRAEFLSTVSQIEALAPGAVVEPCFLELAEPTIAAAVDRAVERGARRLTVVPLLLFAAGHAKRDIPAAVAAAVARHPGVAARQVSVLACHEAMLELSTQRWREALAPLPDVPAEETMLLVVGRGSRDAEANAELARFARLRWERTPVGWLEVAYLAMTEPRLERALELAARLPFRRVVVQPHLLFAGELFAQVERAVSTCREAHSRQQWVVPQYIGPQQLLAQGVLEIAGWMNPAASGRIEV